MRYQYCSQPPRVWTQSSLWTNHDQHRNPTAPVQTGQPALFPTWVFKSPRRESAGGAFPRHLAATSRRNCCSETVLPAIRRKGREPSCSPAGRRAPFTLSNSRKGQKTKFNPSPRAWFQRQCRARRPHYSWDRCTSSALSLLARWRSTFQELAQCLVHIDPDPMRVLHAFPSGWARPGGWGSLVYIMYMKMCIHVHHKRLNQRPRRETTQICMGGPSGSGLGQRTSGSM